MPKAIVLFSGGLDSMLAAKVLMNQGIECIGFNGVLPFVAPDADLSETHAASMAKQINLPLHYYYCRDEYMAMAKNPPHGYGKEMNPCIDCKIHFLQKAKDLMDASGADFIATGEVVGQRPMSQLRHTLVHIEKEAGLKGLLLRPLSAKLLDVTIPEKNGLVDREKLFNFCGRGRTRQFELAELFGIHDYATPAGGCLFTEKSYAARLREALSHDASLTHIDMYLLSIGRQLRLTSGAKVIVSRDETEGIALEKMLTLAPYFFIPDFPAPAAYAGKQLHEREIETVISIISRYGKPLGTQSHVRVYKNGELYTTTQAGIAIADSELEKIRI